MSTCKTIRDLLPLWAGDDLTIEESRAVNAHLASCSSCAQEAESWRSDLAALVARASSDSPPDLPAGFLDQTLDATGLLQAPRPGIGLRSLLRQWPALQPLAAAAVLLALLWFGPVGPDRGPAEGLAWQEVQDVFHGCLEEPVPLSQWSAPEGAGVVAVLTRENRRSGYVLEDCLESDDLTEWRRYPWLAQRMRALERDHRDVMVAVCRDGADDRGRRRSLRRAALSELR